jgi:hypothetical protein
VIQNAGRRYCQNARWISAAIGTANPEIAAGSEDALHLVARERQRRRTVSLRRSHCGDRTFFDPPRSLTEGNETQAVDFLGAVRGAYYRDALIDHAIESQFDLRTRQEVVFEDLAMKFHGSGARLPRPGILQIAISLPTHDRLARVAVDLPVPSHARTRVLASLSGGPANSAPAFHRDLPQRESESSSAGKWRDRCGHDAVWRRNNVSISNTQSWSSHTYWPHAGFSGI